MADHDHNLNESRTPSAEQDAELSPAEAAEQMHRLANLEADESHLRAQAAVMDDEARKIEHEGGDNSQNVAAQLHAQAGLATSVAAEMKQVINEVKSDPSKRLSRRKRDALHTSASVVIVGGEPEASAAASSHGDTAEHRYEMHEAHEIARAQEVKHDEKPNLLTKLKRAVTPHKSESKAESASPHHSTAKEKLKHCVQVVKDTAHKAWDFVAEKSTIVGTAVAGVAVSAWHKAGEVTEAVGHAVMHPVDTAKKMAKGTMSVLRSAGSAICGWLMDADDEDDQPVKAKPVVAKKMQLSPQAMEAVKKLALSKHIGAPTHHEHSESLVPNAWMGMMPSLSGLGVS